MSKKIVVPIKLLVTALIFWWVIHRLGPKRDDLMVYIRNAHLIWLAAAFGILTVIMFLGIWRWQSLLRVQGIRISFYQTTWITAVGLFFNSFLIGSTGGDVLRAWYAAQAAPAHKTQAVFSIAVD